MHCLHENDKRQANLHNEMIQTHRQITSLSLSIIPNDPMTTLDLVEKKCPVDNIGQTCKDPTEGAKRDQSLVGCQSQNSGKRRKVITGTHQNVKFNT